MPNGFAVAAFVIARHVDIFYGGGRAKISKECNFLTLSQLPKKSNQWPIKTILHFVLKFQFDRANCFQIEEASANFSEKVQ